MSSIGRGSRQATLVVMVLGAIGCGGSLGSGGAGPGGGFGKGTGRGGAAGPGGRSGGGAVGGSVGIGGADGPGGAFGTGAGGLGGAFGPGVGGGPGRPSGGAAGTRPGTGGVIGTGGSDPSGCMHSAAGEVPSEHRATPQSCAPNAPVPLPSGGVPGCVLSADCTSHGYGSCTAGLCVSDFCLADGDCQKGYVCACGGITTTVSPPPGETDAASQAYAINICVPATCRMDSDCGPEGYCSPSYNGCGNLEGYYCHGPADTCADPAKDCCGSQYCIWSAAAGAFSCAYQTCIAP
jgi:hypothetical protein